MFWRKASSAHSAPSTRRVRAVKAAPSHSAPLLRRSRQASPSAKFLIENRLGRLRLGRMTQFVAQKAGAYKTYEAALAFANMLAPKGMPQLSLLVSKAAPANISEALSGMKAQWGQLAATASPTLALNRLVSMGRNFGRTTAVVLHLAPVSHMFNQVGHWSGRVTMQLGTVFRQLATHHGLPRIPVPQTRKIAPKMANSFAPAA